MEPGASTTLPRLLLAGGGHSHALLLHHWAMRPQRRPRARISLISRSGISWYSGMVPGLVAGWYSSDEAGIDLRRLCTAAGVRFIAAEITGLDPDGRQLQLAARPPLGWDWLSLDVGAVSHPAPGELGVKPLEGFLAWAAARQQGDPVRIRGAGAAGVELALALRGRGLTVELLLHGQGLKLGSSAANHQGERMLRQAGVLLGRGRSPQPPDQEMVLACTGSHAPAWLASSGLPCDGRGRLFTAATLEVEGAAGIFASGDCGVIRQAPRPPSGVWAVRAAPVLAANLERSLASRSTRPWRPQRRALQLLGDGHHRQPRALALWGPLAFGPSRWLWRWKERIDRRFMERLAPPPAMAGSLPMACRGCGAKLGAGPLQAALGSQGLSTRAEDASVIDRSSSGALLLQSVDGFPALVDDPWLNARLTTLHACSDLWACGATVQSAQALVTLPQGDALDQQELLSQTLAGIRSVLDPLQARLLGGHTLEGRDGAGLSLGLSVNGQVEEAEHWPKGPLQGDQVLLLSQALGSGVLFAAAMAGAAKAGWLEAALGQMQRSQAPLVGLLRAQGCRACTDITGFGLLGHLAEMLAASPGGTAIDLNPEAIPWLPGALQLLEQGHHSSLAAANAGALALLQGPVACSGPISAALRQLLIDPQTCGPLLAALPAARAEAALASLHQAGFPRAAVIGRVRSSG